VTYSITFLQEPRSNLSVERQKTSRSSNHTLILTLPIIRQILQQVTLLVHDPWLASTDFTDSVDTCGDDFGRDTIVDKFVGDLGDYWVQILRWNKLVNRLSESNQDLGHFELMVGEVSDLEDKSVQENVHQKQKIYILVDVSVELENVQLVHTHDS
jgi:hypothetical protein